MQVPTPTTKLGPDIDRYLACTKLFSGVFLCRICDVFTDNPEAHRHEEFLE
jgi:hypothetical protein